MHMNIFSSDHSWFVPAIPSPKGNDGFWPRAASWDGFQIADIRNPLILPMTAFWRRA